MEFRVTVGDSIYGVPPVLETVGIPLFLTCLVLEIFVCAASSSSKTLRPYRGNDAVASLASGFFRVLCGRLFNNVVNVVPFCFVYHHFRVCTLQESFLTHVLCFLAVDFSLYWYHRLSHECHFLWANHSVHHSSEEFNFATALRQSVLESTVGTAFTMWMAFIFPPAAFVFHAQWNFIYQFFMHTKMVGKLGPLEGFLNTPSHHRCHHGRNPKYLDKNYGGVLIVWDRLFGTRCVEEEEPVYGLVTPIKSFDTLYVQFNEVASIVQTSAQQPTLSRALGVWFRSPAWNPDGGWYDAPEVDPATAKPYNPIIPAGLTWYAIASFFVALVFGLPFLSNQDLSASQALWKVVVLTTTLCTATGMLNDRVLPVTSRELKRNKQATESQQLLLWGFRPLFWLEVVRLSLIATMPRLMFTQGLSIEPLSWLLRVISVSFLATLVFFAWRHRTGAWATTPTTISTISTSITDGGPAHVSPLHHHHTSTSTSASVSPASNNDNDRDRDM